MHPMERFFALLRPYKGQFICRNVIRHKETCNCPIIQAFKPTSLSNGIAATVAVNNGISSNTAINIIEAADGYIVPETALRLRNKLIQFLEIK
jgi:hypothetical protein